MQLQFTVLVLNFNSCQNKKNSTSNDINKFPLCFFLVSNHQLCISALQNVFTAVELYYNNLFYVNDSKSLLGIFVHCATFKNR